MELVFKTEVFEGPLDLLLNLISKNKMDICDIQISLILEQYLEYIDELQKSDMEIAGEFIVMASELMYIKSRMLLPKAEKEEDPRENLVKTLMEYKAAKEAAVRLGDLEKANFGKFVKDTDEIAPDKSKILPHSSRLLEKALIRIMNRFAEETAIKPTEMINPLIKKKEVSVSAKIKSVRSYISQRKKVHFDDFFATVKSRSEIIATFMAILELLKIGQLTFLPSEDYTNLIFELNEEYIPDEETEARIYI